MRSFKFYEKRAGALLPGLLAALAIFIFTGCASRGFDVEDLSAGEDPTELSAQDKQKAGEALKVSAINLIEDGTSVLIATNRTAEYTAFTLTNPLRLVIDLPEANLYDVLDTIKVNNQYIKAINVVTYGGKEKIGRIIMELQDGVEHEVRSERKGLIVNFKHDPLAGMPEGFIEDESVVVASSSDVVLADNTVDNETAVVETLSPATSVDGLQSFKEESDVVIQIVSDGAIGKYNTFELSDPARVVIDVWDVTNSTGLKVMRVDATEINDVRVGNHPDKVRFVIDLTGEEIPPYAVTKSGDHITATFSPNQVDENLVVASVAGEAVVSSSDEAASVADEQDTATENSVNEDLAAAEAEVSNTADTGQDVGSDIGAEVTAGAEAVSEETTSEVAAIATEIAATADEDLVVASTEDTAYSAVASEETGTAALDTAVEAVDKAVAEETPAEEVVVVSAEAATDTAAVGADAVDTAAEITDTAALDTAVEAVDKAVAEEAPGEEVVVVSAEAATDTAAVEADAVDTAAEITGTAALDTAVEAVDKAVAEEAPAEEVVVVSAEDTVEIVATAAETDPQATDNNVSNVLDNTDAEIADALKVEKEATAEAAAAVQEDKSVVTTEAAQPVAEVVKERPPVIKAGNHIKNIDYKKIGTKGFLTIETGSKAAYSIKESNNGRTLVLDISDTSIDDSLVRTLDATKLGTPVATISSYQGSSDPAVTRVLIDLASKASHSVIEIEGRLSLVFEPFATAAQKKSVTSVVAAKKAKYNGKKIDLDMMDARITDILRLLAEVSNLNIIASDDVTGTISLRLRDVPWDQAFDIILKAKGLDKVRVGNVIRVAPATRISQERDAALAAVKASEKLEPLGIDFVAINYGKAEDLAEHVKNVLTDRGSVTSEIRTNTLIIKDIKKGIAAARTLITHLDTQIPQVLIEARIVEASSSFSRDLGVQWGVDYQTGGNVNTNFFGSGVDSKGIPVSGQTPSNSTNPLFESRNGARNFAVNLPATGSIGTLGALGFILGKAGQNPLVLDLRLSAGEQEGLLRTISRPRVVTMDNKEAKIEDGESIPFETTSASGTSTIFIDANLSLTVTPHITPDGSVLMKIKASKNSRGTFTTSSGEPSIVKKEASTEVLVRDGETTVIGGIISSDSNHTDTGIPYLKDVPLLGKLFRSKSTKESQKELLIFITPSIMTDKAAG